MPLKLVELKKTPLPKEALVEAILFAWYDLWKEIPQKQSVGIFYSQTMIETGGKSLYGNNISNVKVPNKISEDKEVLYHMLPNTWEILNGKKVIFQPPDRQTWFLSFRTLKDGIQHHLNFVKSGRYSNAWAAVKSGNVKEYATQLKARGYYTAPLADYIKGMNLFYSPYMKSKMYETALAKLKSQISSPVVEDVPAKEEVKEEASPKPEISDLEENVQENMVKDTKEYIHTSKKLAGNWYDPFVKVFSGLFSAFNKKS